MPRIPRVLLTEGVAAPQGARIPYSVGEGSAAAIAGAGQSIAGTFNQFAALEAEKKRVAVEQEARLLQADVEMQLGTGDADLRLAERNPDAYKQKYGELVQRVTEDMRKKAQYPESAQLMTVRLAPTLARHQAEAFRHSNTLFIDRGVAQLDATLDSRKTLAGLATDDADFQAQYKEGEAAIQAAEPLIGANKAGDLRRKFREDVLEARAYKESRENPETFAVEAPVRFAMLDPKKREELMEAARKKNEETRKEIAAVTDKVERKIEALIEKDRKWRLTGLSEAAANRTLTAQQVYDARDRHDIVDATELEHYLTLARKGVAPESDPVLWSAVQADVWGQTPTYTEARITALMARATDGGPGLSGEHGRMALSELNRKREHGLAEGRTQENEQRERHKDAYNRAKEEGLRALGITTPLSQLDKKEAKLVSDFERELNARVLDPAGNVRTDLPVRQQMLDVLPAFMNRQSSDARLAYKDQASIVGDLVGSPVPEVLDPKFIQWYAQQQKATETLASDPRTLGLYRLRREQLLRLARTRTDYLNAEARRNAAGLGGKSVGGYVAPREEP